MVKEKDRVKKQVLLRLSPALWAEIAQWAEDEYRSINSQIEFILNDAVKSRKNRS
ncbi:MAG: Arc family DNA-binding protein [Coriobacteriia bacterium]|nr:Arc family DNA-binding protein [Coriobacteriia bacterium]